MNEDTPWGIVSDAHGNPAGLEECLHALTAAGAERLFFLGDAVGYLPLESEVVQLLEDSGAECIAGNHEAMLLGRLPLDARRDEVYGLAAAAERLPPEHLARIAEWPDRLLRGSGDEILMVHGGPYDPWRQYVYQETDIAGFAELGYRAIFLGQTHRPFIRRAGETLVVNVGSCGLPRDIPGMSSCVLYDPIANSARILRRPFDGAALIERAERVAQVASAVQHLIRGTPDIPCDDHV
jgi:predicted phosphodiesterase